MISRSRLLGRLRAFGRRLRKGRRDHGLASRGGRVVGYEQIGGEVFAFFSQPAVEAHPLDGRLAPDDD